MAHNILRLQDYTSKINQICRDVTQNVVKYEMAQE